VTASAIAALLGEHVAGQMPLGVLGARLRCAEWLRDEDVSIVDAVTGKLPVPWSPDVTVAVVAAEGGALYLTIEDRLNAAEVADGLRGGPHADAVVRAAAVV
jgi:hypothetical protein